MVLLSHQNRLQTKNSSRKGIQQGNLNFKDQWFGGREAGRLEFKGLLNKDFVRKCPLLSLLCYSIVRQDSMGLFAAVGLNKKLLFCY